MEKKEIIRLYRGEGRKLDMTKMPDWMKSTSGMWYSSDINVSSRFAELREGSKIHYIEVPKSAADTWRQNEGIERGEYLVPKQVLKNIKKKFIKK